MKYKICLLALALCLCLAGCGAEAQSAVQSTAQSVAQSAAEQAESAAAEAADQAADAVSKKAQQAAASAADALKDKASEELQQQMDECESFFQEYLEYMQTFDMDSADIIGVMQYSVYSGKLVDYTNRLESAAESAVTDDDKAYYEAKRAEIDAIIDQIPELKSELLGNK